MFLYIQIPKVKYQMSKSNIKFDMRPSKVKTDKPTEQTTPHIAKKPDTRTDNMALFGCSFKVPGYMCAPDAFKDTLRRGSYIKAAAFAGFHDYGHAYIVQEYPSGTSEQQAKSRVLKQLNSTGTFGKFFPQVFETGLKSLPLLKFTHHDTATAPHFTDAEIITNKGEQLRSNAIVATPAARPSLNHYAALGLPAGASRADVEAAWKILCKRLHPDKGGDAEAFIAAHDAHKELAGYAVAVVTEPPPMALTYEASAEAINEQRLESNEVVRVLREKLVAAEAHSTQITNTWAKKTDDEKAVALRTQAQRFVGEHFNCSARYWTVVEIRRWFRITSPTPNCHSTDPAFKAWVDEQRALGDDIRKGNEELDPHVLFVAWHPGEWLGDTKFQVKLGLDRYDVVDNGHSVVMASNVFACVPKYRAKLLAMGFDTRVIATERHEPRWSKDFDQMVVTNNRKAFELRRDERPSKRQRTFSPVRGPTAAQLLDELPDE